MAKEEGKKPISVSLDETTGIFSFSGRAFNITEKKNKALAPYGKMVHNYGVVLELLPTDKQRQALNVQIGNARFIRNRYLDACKSYYEQNHSHLDVPMFKKELLPEEKKLHPFLLKSDKFALEAAVEEVGNAFSRFFKIEARYPRFAKVDTPRGSKYTTKSTNGNICLSFTGEAAYIKLPKFSSPIRFVMPKNMPSSVLFGANVRILKATVKKTGNRYHVSLGMEDVIDLVHPITNIPRAKVYAADMGLKDFAIYGNHEFAEKVPNPRWIKLHERRLRRKQQALSRKKKGSQNFKKAKLAVLKEQRKCANQRKDMNHKLSRKIADEADAFICENLNIKGMMKNRHLAKAIASVGWGQFLAFVKYKIEAKGGRFIKVDRFFASSKTCSCCGYRKKDLELKDREWVCPRCKVLHDRDINAKQNLLAEGIRLLKDSGINIVEAAA